MPYDCYFNQVAVVTKKQNEFYVKMPMPHLIKMNVMEHPTFSINYVTTLVLVSSVYFYKI